MFFTKKQIVHSQCFNGKEGVGGRPKFCDTSTTWSLRIHEMPLQETKVRIKAIEVIVVQDPKVETLP
ncbi:hypothetical protein NQ318_013483 [Aromia moschata]|uniref:Uncharacterized protein n=1 Tax=Aromia moschata TaxID=1265417 RepID=A0AAV8YCJ2_9CUCU|nr:hypothetical protein NQ318_013483 [Aromia moschata]